LLQFKIQQGFESLDILASIVQIYHMYTVCHKLIKNIIAVFTSG
jgi:hypothetical protein